MVTQAKELTEQEQAAFFYARERRRSLAGILKLNRTARIGAMVTMEADITDALLSPLVASPITFQTAIRVNSAADSGLIFGYGSGTRGIGLCEADVVASCKPGQGMVRIWVNGREAARNDIMSSLDDFALPGVDGVFAKAGALPSSITEQGAPSGFEVIEPLSVYTRQYPRHFV